MKSEMNYNITETLERFYICTSLPIIAINLDGSIIDSSGYEANFDNLLNKNNIINKAIEKIEHLKKHHTYIIPCLRSINYTVCPIDPKAMSKGLYILGPHSCLRDNPLGIPYKPRCLINNLVSLLYTISKDIHHGRHFKGSYSFHVRKAVDYINSNYNNDLTLLDVANYLNINKSYLCTLLKKETGKTFTQLLNEIRIEKSKNLLLENKSSMLNIALQVGFNNQNYFNITFKKITGMTPIEYRSNI